jgi:hypothetical protein
MRPPIIVQLNANHGRYQPKSPALTSLVSGQRAGGG